MADNNLYDGKFYIAHKRDRGYGLIAAVLRDFLAPASVADFGCGLGVILHHLRQAGCEVRGVDGSHAARAEAFVDVMVADLSQPVHFDISYDLGISIEVAEHLPESAADTLVATIARHSRRAIFFSAARPGQKGIGHINCQPKEYWAEKFARHGFVRSRTLELAARAALYPLRDGPSWISKNMMILLNGWPPLFRVARRFPKYGLRSLWWRAERSRIGPWISADPAVSGK